MALDEKLREDKLRLIRNLKREGIIRSSEVEKAFLRVPREDFVSEPYRMHAYVDTPLPIPFEQTISAPHMCAIMCEALKLKAGEKLLEIGAGSGYHAALCAEIVSPSDSGILLGEVVTIELIGGLAHFAWGNIKRTGYDDRIHVVVADGSFKLPLRKIFDAALVTAGAPKIPYNIIEVIKESGRVICPVGSRFYQRLLLIKKIKDKLDVKDLGGCIFVPLRGMNGHGGRHYLG